MHRIIKLDVIDMCANCDHTFILHTRGLRLIQVYKDGIVRDGIGKMMSMSNGYRNGKK